MGKVLLRHVVVGFDSGGNVILVDTDGDPKYQGGSAVRSFDWQTKVAKSPHEHMLGPLRDFAANLEQVRALERLEPAVQCKQVGGQGSTARSKVSASARNQQVLVVVVAVVNDGAVELLPVLHNDFVDVVGNHWCGFARLGVDIGVEVVDNVREDFFRLLVQVGDCDTSGQNRIVGVPRCLE